MDSLKIAVLSSSDIEGGAARCSYRLHRGLLSSGASSTYVVQEKRSTDPDILINKTVYGKLAPILRPAIDRIPVRLYPKREKAYFSTGLMTSFCQKHINDINPDIINLHYVAAGFVPIAALKSFNKPIVWTLHDSWPFTGGCHLQGDCKRYENSCGACPRLSSENDHDLSYWILRKKRRAWDNLGMTVVADSTWLAGCARNSAVFSGCRVEAINPGLDLDVFRPMDKAAARALLSLPQDKKLILYGAMHSTSDPNKGFHLLKPAIRRLSSGDWGKRAELLIFGASGPSDQTGMGMRAHYMGRLYDDMSLAILYSAADVMVVPSLRESFGQTASEAMACGSPVVAFGATGLLDIVEHKKNGYLAAPYEPEDLAEGIGWILSGDSESLRNLSANARLKAEKSFSIQMMARKYISLFEEAVSLRKTGY